MTGQRGDCALVSTPMLSLIVFVVYQLSFSTFRRSCSLIHACPAATSPLRDDCILEAMIMFSFLVARFSAGIPFYSTRSPTLVSQLLMASLSLGGTFPSRRCSFEPVVVSLLNCPPCVPYSTFRSFACHSVLPHAFHSLCFRLCCLDGLRCLRAFC